ncbi:interferon-like [Phoenicopterus ruber ruber]
MAVPVTSQTCLQHGTLMLLLLLPAPTTALACHHLRPRDTAFAWDSLQLLQAMAPSPPQPCHHQHMPFPDTLLHTNHPQQAAATALRILQHLFDTFSSPSTPHHWDAQARHDLLNHLQHNIRHLEQCLTDNGTLFQGRGPRNVLLSINKYFRDIQDFLRTHNHSACAWDHVRLEARASFLRLHNLTRTMRD